jgi:hypothetical protein
MREVDHTHPHTDEPFGEMHNRGSVVAADGGTSESAEESTQTMDDVSHEPPSEGANRAFERGTEGRTDTV